MLYIYQGKKLFLDTYYKNEKGEVKTIKILELLKGSKLFYVKSDGINSLSEYIPYAPLDRMHMNKYLYILDGENIRIVRDFKTPQFTKNLDDFHPDLPLQEKSCKIGVKTEGVQTLCKSIS